MEKYVAETVPLCVHLEDGSMVIHYFLVTGRGSFLPKGAHWSGPYTWTREPTDENVEDNLHNSFHDRPFVSWRRLSAGDIPQDRTFRGAWEDNGREIVHNIEKAREIKRHQLRHERAALFPTLDARWQRAVGQKRTQEAAEVETKRQKLRDAPADPRIDTAASVEDLKAITLPEV